MYSDAEITRILEKLETATNLQKPGALSQAELEKLRGFAKHARHLETTARDCAILLRDAAVAGY